jgi:repressor LexA
VTSALTPKMAETLAFIRGFIARHGFSPTLQQIGDAVGVNGKARAHTIITGLVDRGYVRRLPNKMRGLDLVDPLANFSTDELIAELTRRGVSVPSAELGNPSAGDGAARPSSHDGALPRQPVSPTVHVEERYR